MTKFAWFLQSGKVREKSENQENSEKVREFDIPKSGKNHRVRQSQGKSKYQGAKVNKYAEKIELLYADCVQWFKFSSAHFARSFILYLHF